MNPAAGTRAKVEALFLEVLRDSILAKRLELWVWNYTMDTCSRDGIALYWDNPKVRYRYTTRALALRFNLRNEKNPELLRR